MLHERERAVIDRQAQDGHIVSIQNTVTESICLPLCYENCCPRNKLFKKDTMFITKIFVLKISVEVINDVVEHLWHHLAFHTIWWSWSLRLFAFPQEYFKRSKSHKCRRHSHHDCTFFVNNISTVHGVSFYFSFITDDKRCGPWRRNTEMRHSLWAEKFSYAWTKDCTAISIAAVWGFTGAFQLEIKQRRFTDTKGRFLINITEGNGPTITELTREIAKLITTVAVAYWLGSFEQFWAR